jgi:addiction module HigA family antidote
MMMHDPPHPGEVIRELCLEPLDLSVTETARALGVSRKTLSGILNGRAGISAEMAVRLSIVFDTTAESWLEQQAQYDLWNAERHHKDLRVKRLVAGREAKTSKRDVVQVRNPRSGKYVKIDRSKGQILSHKKSEGPYKGVPVASTPSKKQ